MASPDAGTVFIVSPTYYGMAADVPGCAEVAHAAGAALVVDQAWGPHFGFHPGLPESALRQGADAVLTSTHKIVGSLTQSAMLHLADTERIDEGRLARAVRLARSTSPSSLLLASLDAARRQLAVHGAALLERTLAAAAACARRGERDRRLRGGRRRVRGDAGRGRLGSDADRHRRAPDGPDGVRDRRRAARRLRHPPGARHARDGRAGARRRPAASSRWSTSPATSPRASAAPAGPARRRRSPARRPR